MPLSYTTKPNGSGYIQVQFYDGSETAKTIEVKYFGELPELKEPQVKAEVKEFKDRGAIQGFEYGEDSVDIPEVTFEVDVVDDQVSSNNYELKKWFQEFKDAAGSSLVSTNSGTVSIRKSDKSLTTISIPSDINMLGMIVLFGHSDGTKKFGLDFPQVEIISSSFKSGDGRGKFSFTVKVWSAANDTLALK
ncbi:hypothetical protein LN42_00595 [Marinitoga sp. 1137]|uniref:hypothetical protein n=1 Tax=Marinitoga sp. 1137 TaxID=1545835 RepID=UPI00095091FB|nr:hypothetical protein [Marinitoga sp. 1137]APT75059.1 hypothetical protein LN42_00595 [Marinitoga sp. 1137]